MNTLGQFIRGRRVRYLGPTNGKPLHPDRVGKTAVVRRTIKQRRSVEIEWDDTRSLYEAMPQNLAIIS